MPEEVKLEESLHELIRLPGWIYYIEQIVMPKVRSYKRGLLRDQLFGKMVVKVGDEHGVPCNKRGRAGQIPKISSYQSLSLSLKNNESKNQ